MRIQFAAVNTCDGRNWRQVRGGMAYYRQAAANAILSDPDVPDRTAQFWPALREFDGPVRVVIGTCDYVDHGASVWSRIVPRLAQGSIQVIEGAGHNAWMDRPAEVSHALRQALQAGRL